MVDSSGLLKHNVIMSTDEKVNNFRAWVMTAIVAAVVVWVVVYNRQVAPSSPYLDGTVTLAGQVLNIQLADDLSEQSAGLANRPSMAENEGMLFVLAKVSTPEFWMKDMLFPIDIIWIRDGKVVDIDSRVGTEPGETDNDRKRYLPKEEVNMVLETKASWAEKNNLSIGDEVKIVIKK